MIGRKKFHPHADAMMMLFSAFTRAALRITAQPSGLSLPDEDDLPYLDAATTIAADFLITGNSKHFPSRRYGPVEIVSPRAFLRTVA